MLMHLGAMRRDTDWAGILAAASKQAVHTGADTATAAAAAVATGGFPALPAFGLLPALFSAALAAAPGRIQQLDAWWSSLGGSEPTSLGGKNGGTTVGGSGDDAGGGNGAAALGAREGCAISEVEWVCTSMDGGMFRPSETGWRAASLRPGTPGLRTGPPGLRNGPSGLFLGALPDSTAHDAAPRAACAGCAIASRTPGGTEHAGIEPSGFCPAGGSGVLLESGGGAVGGDATVRGGGAVKGAGVAKGGAAIRGMKSGAAVRGVAAAACPLASAVCSLTWRDVNALTAAPCTLRSRVVCAGVGAVPAGGCTGSGCHVPLASSGRQLGEPLGSQIHSDAGAIPAGGGCTGSGCAGAAAAVSADGCSGSGCPVPSAPSWRQLDELSATQMGGDVAGRNTAHEARESRRRPNGSDVSAGGCSGSGCPVPRTAPGRQLDEPSVTQMGSDAAPHEGRTARRLLKKRRQPSLEVVDCLKAQGGAANCTKHVLFESISSMNQRLKLAQNHKVRMITTPTHPLAQPAILPTHNHPANCTRHVIFESTSPMHQRPTRLMPHRGGALCGEA
jgi:hypothetical protein